MKRINLLLITALYAVIIIFSSCDTLSQKETSEKVNLVTHESLNTVGKSLADTFKVTGGGPPVHIEMTDSGLIFYNTDPTSVIRVKYVKAGDTLLPGIINDSLIISGPM